MTAAHFVRHALIDPRGVPAATTPALVRWRRAWFPGAGTGLLSLLLLAALVAGGLKLFEWAIVDAHWRGTTSDACAGDSGACWSFIVARWKPWLAGDYDASQLWRAWTCFIAFALFWTWVVRRSHTASMQRVLAGFIILPVAMVLLLLGGVAGLPFVAPTRWGGLLLTMVVTLMTFATALPIGLALALGRRSRLPVVRLLCAVFIEGMRAIPLLAVLFIAATLLPMFLPNGSNVDLFSRVVAAFALFNAAMAAEVFRGGLQSVGRGQLEAATTVGLSDLAALRLVVLPQAVTAVVPALVNIMIAVIKETTLLSVIGVNDLLGAVENGAKSPDWMGPSNVLTTGHVFLALAYLAMCYGLSRYSRRLEAKA
jgi:general L-amino acid transport system permease protein